MESTINRFSRIKKIGGRAPLTRDFYHNLLTMPWRYFFIVFVIFFILFNLVFATLYWISTNSLAGTDNSFWQAFVFSVQTFSTVGYGAFHPNSNWAYSISICESLLSVFVTAVLTGLVFTKFSRPTARIIFSKNILIHNFNGNRVLTFRVGNLRGNQIAEAQINVIALMTLTTPEGFKLRQQVDLKLTRKTSLFFALTWSIFHIIDQESPLSGLNYSDFKKRDIEIGVSLMGYDSTFSQAVHASGIYSPDDLVFDRYFMDVIENDDKEGRAIAVNYNHFHNLA